MSVTLRGAGPGRAEVHGADAGGEGLEEALGTALDRAFEHEGITSVAWWIPVGAWAARRTAWRLGFAYGGVLRGWADGADAWAFTLARTDDREPVGRWLEAPPLSGDGVRLRALTDDDVPRVVEGIGDADTQHWLAFMPRDPGTTEGRRYVETARERLATNHTITWAFTAADDDTMLGAIGLYRLEAEPELGYWTHPDARGRGLTTRAARVAVGHAFGELGLTRLAAYASVENTPSRRVLEGLGMRPTGVLRRAARTGDGTVVDLAGYDLLPEEAASPRR